MEGWVGGSLALLTILIATPASSPLPTMLSKPGNLTSAEGETASLPCTIHSLGPRQQMVWLQGRQVLAAGSLILTPDSRFSVLPPPQAKLLIQGVTREDEGEYTCQVTTVAGVLEVQHRLQVRVPPSIEPVPPGGAVTGHSGSPVTLRCSAGGVPPPLVQWHKSVGELPGGRMDCGGSCYIVHNLSRSDSGDYLCTASNGVGHLQHATVSLSVLYPPGIRAVAQQVQAGGGSPALLACQVEGQPQPAVDWFREGQLLEPGKSRVSVEGRGGSTLHQLNIDRSTAADFGNFSCVASNLMGASRDYIEVHGRPSSPWFLPLREGGQLRGGQVDLRWKVSSHFQVSLFTLLFRKEGEMEWVTVRVVGPRQQGVEQGAEHTLDNLTNSATYEAIVQAQNGYGWSLPSKILVFHTAAMARKSASSLWSDSPYTGSSGSISPSHIWITLCLLYGASK